LRNLNTGVFLCIWRASFNRLLIFVIYCGRGTLAPSVFIPEESQGNILLHDALDVFAGEPIISRLFNAYPEGALIRGKNGWLPLHLVCWKGHSFEVVKQMVQIYPDGVSIHDDYGNLACLFTVSAH
jgi:hypothetical protein